MCGICGAVSIDAGHVLAEHELQRMVQLLAHRGPDSSGFYSDNYASLGMRRLSIIDLLTGQQPVANEDGTIQAIFNGEIYNYRELGSDLKNRGHVFKSASDSEVIVHAFEEFGVDCVNHFNGMFAIAVWDVNRRKLFLARDRLGIKPLYYWSGGDILVFGSELSAIGAHPMTPKEIDLHAIDQLLTVEYVPTPRTIFRNVRKLPAGHWLIFDFNGVRVEQYWDVPERDVSRDTSFSEYLRELIEDSVRLRMVSDVPLGALLSGGIDSSTVLAAMQKASNERIKTFSIGFDDATYNELPYARLVAEQFDTDHYEEVLAPDINDLVYKLIGHLDEPLADFSIIPTFLVSSVARRQVKVVLSGDGGDELFAGYDTYLAQQADSYYRFLPTVFRQRTVPAMVRLIPPQPAKKGIVNKFKRFVDGAALPGNLQHARWMVFLSRSERDLLYKPDLLASLNDQEATSFLEQYFGLADSRDFLAQQQYVDLKSYLVDDILTKVDRMSMAVGLEARTPLLDHRIVEFAINLPPHLKIQKAKSKILLREAMKTHLPDAVLNKPKQGFSIPLKHWLRTSMRPMMLDLLSEDTVRRRGYFNPETINLWISEHLENRANHSHRLWALIVLELWLQKHSIS